MKLYDSIGPNPRLVRMFIAEKGKGAFLNNHRLRVSARTSLGDALIGTGIPFKGHGNTAAVATLYFGWCNYSCWATSITTS